MGFDHGLNNVIAPWAYAQPHGIISYTPEKTLTLQVFHNCHSSVKAFHASIGLAIAVDQSIISKNVDELKVVAISNRKIIRVMGWSNLEAKQQNRTDYISEFYNIKTRSS